MIVEIASRTRAGRVSLGRLKRKAEKILCFLEQNRVELSLVLVNNLQMRRLNARYRKKDRPTDVLSFPTGPCRCAEERLLGDVVISLPQARKQAKARGRSLDDELEALLIHGILHLLGYDHERSEREAKRMERLERTVQRALCQDEV